MNNMLRFTLAAILVLVATLIASAQTLPFYNLVAPMVPSSNGPPPVMPAIPILVAGLRLPAAMTPTQASMSTDVPRCIDSTWGAGCNVSNQDCIQPTVGTPLETCQPPAELIVTGGSASGGVGVINYTSAANLVYPVGEVLLIKNATQVNWNTPIVHVTGLPTFSGTSATLPFAAITGNTNPFPVGSKVYVGGLSATDAALAPSFGWAGQNPNTAATVTASTSTSVTYSLPAPVIGSLVTTNGGVQQTQNASFTNLPVTTLTGAGSGMTINATIQTGQGVTARGIANPGTGYNVGDTVTVPTSLIGVPPPCCSGNVLTVGTAHPKINADAYYGTAIDPWVTTASSCNPVTHACTVTFTTPNACASSCVSTATQIVAGQFADIIVSWHYGEQVSNSLQSGQIMACVDAQHVSGVQFAAFSLDGGAFTQVNTPLPDPRGPGRSGLSVANTPIYCAQFQASSVADGLHEVVAIVCPNVGYCSQLNSQLTADATAGSAVLTAHGHGLQHFTLLGVQSPGDPVFPNFNWNASSNRNNQSGQLVTGASGAGAGSFTINYTPLAPAPQIPVGTFVTVDGVTAKNACAVTGGTASGATITINLTGTCSFPTQSEVNIAGVVASGNFAWNGTLVPVIAGGTCTAGTCSIQVASVSTATWVSGGFVTANWNGPCQVTASAVGSVTCATNNAAAVLGYGAVSLTNAGSGGTTTGTFSNVPLTGGTGTGALATVGVANIGGVIKVSFASITTVGVGYTIGDVFSALPANIGGVTGFSATAIASGNVSSQGNLFCNPGGAGDIQPPFDPAAVVNGLMDPGHFQLIPYANRAAGSGLPAYSCVVQAQQTGCQVTAANPNCGNVATKNETLWVTLYSAGLDQHRPMTWPTMNLRASLYVWTNAGKTIQSQIAYVDSWNTAAGISGCQSAVLPAGTLAGIGSVTPCNNTKSAQYALAATETGLVQTVSQPGGTGTCTLFTRTGNTSGAIPFYVGEPVDFQGADTNAGAQFRMFGLYWIVSASSNAVSLARTPGGPCISENPTGIADTTASTATLYNDIGFDSILLECNASFGCSSANPETYLDQVSISINPTITFYSKSAYLTIAADTASGATTDNVDLIQGSGGWFQGSGGLDQGGRIRVAVDSAQTALSLTAAVPIGPTPGNITPTGGSLAACPSPNAAHQCETLTFPAILDLGTKIANGAKYQAPTAAGSPGQSLVIKGTTGAGWDCGSTATAPCLGNVVGGVLAPGIIGATTTSVTFINDAASGALTYGFTTTILAAGSGGSSTGTFTNVALNPLPGGSNGAGGSGALATLTTATVSCGGACTTIAVTAATVTSPGTNYLNGDIVTGSVGGVSNFQLTVKTAEIIPVNLIMELAAGTFGGPCANATTGVAIPTPGAAFCMGMTNAQTALGTNSNSYPIQLGNTAGIDNSNCLSVNTGGGGLNRAPMLMSNVVSGGVHDIVTLTSGASSGANLGVLAVQAANLCNGAGTGPFVFTNDLLALGSVTDFWWDSQNNTGATPFNDFLGTGGSPTTSGAFLITNSTRFNTGQALDFASYAWGSSSKFSCCSCIIRSVVEIDNNCQNNGISTIPVANGGTVNPDGTSWLPIIGSLDGNGNNITCTGPSGTENCVTNATKTIQVAQGTLPNTIAVSWGAYMICNMTSPPLNPAAVMIANNPLIASYNNNTSPATVTVSLGLSPVTQNCALSQNPAVFFYNGIHIDWDFIQSGVGLPPTGVGHNGSPRAPFTYFNSFVQDNQACSPCGFMEGILLQDGGNFDLAFNNMNGGLTQLVVPGQFSFVSWGVPGQASTVTNFILSNSFMGTFNGGNENNPTLQDEFVINSSGGKNVQFPAANLDPKNSGFWGVAGTLVSPIAGSTVAGDTDNVADWPTATRSVDGLGNPQPGASPNANSLQACPFFCTLHDLGNGSL
jgi:hypothetical protein